VSDAAGPIWSHVTSALGSGDLSYDEMLEVIAQFRIDAQDGERRAQALLDVATQWQASHT
jgi:4-carboxymuconolactone decarboxylase